DEQRNSIALTRCVQAITAAPNDLAGMKNVEAQNNENLLGELMARHEETRRERDKLAARCEELEKKHQRMMMIMRSLLSELIN
ncbi:hypothetical protein PMAYCL1PPCAC_20514, partial [Pristionchus mayeri]